MLAMWSALHNFHLFAVAPTAWSCERRQAVYGRDQSTCEASILLGAPILLPYHNPEKCASTQLHETTRVEEVEARRCKARLEHLVTIGLPQKDEATKWNDKRMDRILADYMLRRGYHRSATQLAKEHQIEVLSPHGLAKANACFSSVAKPKTA